MTSGLVGGEPCAVFGGQRGTWKGTKVAVCKDKLGYDTHHHAVVSLSCAVQQICLLIASVSKESSYLLRFS